MAKDGGVWGTLLNPYQDKNSRQNGVNAKDYAAAVDTAVC
jgi:hypothetical protein